MNNKFLKFLSCPKTKKSLIYKKNKLFTADKKNLYRVNRNNIIKFAEEFYSNNAKLQEIHYKNIHQKYLEGMKLPHTEEYTKYLDRELELIVNKFTVNNSLGYTLELCCGSAEGLDLFSHRIRLGFGIDISEPMLNQAKKKFDTKKFIFLQGDAILLPLKSSSFDSVIILGGIHHVSDRKSLFFEIHRILKPGGIFVWREPVSDFILWKIIRFFVYRISPSLNSKTEEPLLYNKTVPYLSDAGLNLKEWKTVGFFGFCLFMNSDVLLFNKLFKFIPYIRQLTKLFILVDKYLSSLKSLKRRGLIVLGCAKKPM
jgi:SAM-dependent methyltransferase